MSIVRQDEIGLYIIADGAIWRPGNVAGYSHAYNMDSANLVKGDKVKTYHGRGSPLLRLTLDSGVKLYWHYVCERTKT